MYSITKEYLDRREKESYDFYKNRDYPKCEKIAKIASLFYGIPCYVKLTDRRLKENKYYFWCIRLSDNLKEYFIIDIDL
ncbi:hypothetical protein AB832_07595 [Flavobacteriaceae bacterium (ex Bugula neritina AB1)]|nr:hypothetical protein AB832_07595 [Flavobacteriaceae bacterium (ex Bugula neritina AB1)]